MRAYARAFWTSELHLNVYARACAHVRALRTCVRVCLYVCVRAFTYVCMRTCTHQLQVGSAPGRVLRVRT